MSMTYTDPRGIRRLAFAALAALSLVPAARADQRRLACQDPSGNILSAAPYPSASKLRVSRVTPTSTKTYVKDVSAPSNFAYNTAAGYPLVACDSSGDLFSAAIMDKSSGGEAIQIVRVTPSGATSSQTYQPTTSSNGVMSLYGVAVDPSGNAYVLGDYASTNGGARTSFVLKTNPANTSRSVNGLPLPSGYSQGYTLYPGDVVAAPSGSVYVASSLYSTNSSTSPDVLAVACFGASFGATPTFNDPYPAPANTASGGGGSLVIDASSHLTYLAEVAAPDGQGGMVASTYPIQIDASGNLRWSGATVTGLAPYATLVDSAGDVVFSSYTGSVVETTLYRVAKITGATGALAWSQTIYPSPAPNSGYAVSVTGLCQDASGDYLAAYTNLQSSSATAEVDRLARDTGGLVANYPFAGSGHDYGVAVFPTSTSGTFLAAGVGLSGGKYVPLDYRYGSGAWSQYLTTPQ